MRQDQSAEVAVITGSGAGIGKACALRFANAGMAVLVADISGSSANSTCKIIADNGGKAIACQADVSAEKDCQNVSDTALNAWGRIDILVANAGVQIGGSLLETTEEDWDKILGESWVLAGWLLILPWVLKRLTMQNS